MSWTAPRTFVTGELITAAILNLHLRDNLLALGIFPVGTAGQVLKVNAGATAPEWGAPAARRCLLRLNANQTLSNGSVVEVLWDAEVSDPDAWHSLVTNTGRVTPTLAGLYLVIAHITFSAHGANFRVAEIRKNGTQDLTFATDEVVPSSVINARVKIVRCFDLNGSTDYVNVYATQNSGGNLDLIGSATHTYTWFEVIYLGA